MEEREGGQVRTIVEGVLKKGGTRQTTLIKEVKGGEVRELRKYKNAKSICWEEEKGRYKENGTQTQ